MKQITTSNPIRNGLPKTNSWWIMNKTSLSAIIGLFLFFGGNFNAQTRLVVPDTNEGTSFIGPYANAARQLQLIIDDSLLTSLQGKYLTSISYRLPGSTAAAWPTSALTISNYNIFLSDSVEPADRQLDFAANVVGTQTQVRSGSLAIPTEALTVGSNPNAFSFKITFDTPWQYNGGNLLIETRHSGTGISSRTVHATGTSSAGYGTLFSAIWQSTGAVLQGNFTYVEISAEDSLGTNYVKIGTNPVIYPNPVKDVLFVKAEKEYASYSIFNTAGQIVVSEKISSTASLNVSRLPVGNYLLKLTDKNGNVEATKFIKK